MKYHICKVSDINSTKWRDRYIPIAELWAESDWPIFAASRSVGTLETVVGLTVVFSVLLHNGSAIKKNIETYRNVYNLIQPILIYT